MSDWQAELDEALDQYQSDVRDNERSSDPPVTQEDVDRSEQRIRELFARVQAEKKTVIDRAVYELGEATSPCVPLAEVREMLAKADCQATLKDENDGD